MMTVHSLTLTGPAPIIPGAAPNQATCEVRLLLSYDTRGMGTEADPSRRVTQIWTTDGQLVVEWDPCPYKLEPSQWTISPAAAPVARPGEGK